MVVLKPPAMRLPGAARDPHPGMFYRTGQGSACSVHFSCAQLHAHTFHAVCLQNADPDQPVMIYCTGGIRCDVYGTYLRQKG